MAQKCRFPQAAAPSGGCEVGRVPSDCVLLLELWVVLFGCVLFLAILSALCLPLFCLLPLISPPATLGLLYALLAVACLLASASCTWLLLQLFTGPREATQSTSQPVAGPQSRLKLRIGSAVRGTSAAQKQHRPFSFVKRLLLLVFLIYDDGSPLID